MSNNSESRICQNCRDNFVIEPDDFGFYEKIKVPPPTFCPRCRMQRRHAWKNETSLYRSNCSLCKKAVVTIYSPESGITIFCVKCWWSDSWDSKSYGVDYDFSRPFFGQLKELSLKVPHMALINDNGIASVNCEYTQDFAFGKNCYMVFIAWHIEDAMYSYFLLAGRDIVDCMTIRSRSERIYECYMASGCYNVRYTNFAKDSIDSAFLYDCIDCKNCFMSTGLRGKKFYFKNKQYSEKEYKKIVDSYRLDTYSGVEKAKKRI